MNATTLRTAQDQPDAVVWIDERHAIIARCEPPGDISTVEVRRLARPESRYLGDIVHEIGGRERIMLVGPDPMRLALERRYVAVSHRPDRLVAPPLPSRAVSDGIEHPAERTGPLAA